MGSGRERMQAPVGATESATCSPATSGGLEQRSLCVHRRALTRAAALDISDRRVRRAIGLACKYCRSYVRGAEAGEFKRAGPAVPVRGCLKGDSIIAHVGAPSESWRSENIFICKPRFSLPNSARQTRHASSSCFRCATARHSAWPLSDVITR